MTKNIIPNHKSWFFIFLLFSYSLSYSDELKLKDITEGSSIEAFKNKLMEDKIMNNPSGNPFQSTSIIRPNKSGLGLTREIAKSNYYTKVTEIVKDHIYIRSSSEKIWNKTSISVEKTHRAIVNNFKEFSERFPKLSKKVVNAKVVFTIINMAEVRVVVPTELQDILSMSTRAGVAGGNELSVLMSSKDNERSEDQIIKEGSKTFFHELGHVIDSAIVEDQLKLELGDLGRARQARYAMFEKAYNKALENKSRWKRCCERGERECEKDPSPFFYLLSTSSGEFFAEAFILWLGLGEFSAYTRCAKNTKDFRETDEDTYKFIDQIMKAIMEDRPLKNLVPTNR